MTILKSNEIKDILNGKESSLITMNFQVNDSFLGESDEFHKNYFQRHIFGELTGSIESITYGKYDDNNNRILEVKFFVTKELQEELVALENKVEEIDLHQLFMNGAVEILRPIYEQELLEYHNVPRKTFMVAEIFTFFHQSLAEQRLTLSRRIFGTDIFSNASFHIQPELLESPVSNICYVRVTVSGLDQIVAKFMRKKALLQVINSEISSDYEAYTQLEKPFNNSDVETAQRQPEVNGQWNLPLKHIVEISKSDIANEDYPMLEVVKDYVYDDLRQRDVYLTFEPIAVNPLTQGLIVKVDGHIRF